VEFVSEIMLKIRPVLSVPMKIKYMDMSCPMMVLIIFQSFSFLCRISYVLWLYTFALSLFFFYSSFTFHILC